MARIEHRKLLGETIRAHREKVGLTQEALAEKAAVSAKYLGEVERGVVNVSVDVLVRVAKILRTKVSALTRRF